MAITFEGYATKTLTARLHRRPRLLLGSSTGGRVVLHRPAQLALTGSRTITGQLALHRAPQLRLSDRTGALILLRHAPQLALGMSAPIPEATVLALTGPGHQLRLRTLLTHTLTAELERPHRLLLASTGARALLRRAPRLYLHDNHYSADRTAVLLQQPELLASMSPGITLDLADGFHAGDQPQSDLIHALLDLITCSDSYSVVAAALQSLADGASLADVAQMIIAADLLDSFIASVVQEGTAQLTVMLADSLQAGDTTDALSVVLAALADGFYATLTVSTGEDTWTAWVMTTQTKAMRRYTNWAFNSYAVLGGAFLGAGPEGIYRMGGDTDAGAAIQWAIRTGKLNFASDGMKGVPLVHIGATTSGDLLLRVQATTVRGQEVEQTYRMTPAVTGAAREHRVPVGRGFRSIYWTFEIASDADGAAATVHEWHAVPVQHTGKLI